MWPSGQTRAKHGLHESLSVITRACAESGGVKRGARRAEERRHRAVERGGDVHEPRVVGDHVRARATCRSIASSSVVRPGEVDADAARRAAGSRAVISASFAEPNEPDLVAARGERLSRASAKWRAGQRLAGPYSAPGANADDRARRGRARSFASVARARRLVDREARLGQRPAQRLARGLRERGVALDDERQRRLVERAAVVQQAVAHLAAIAGAHAECPRATESART